MEGHFSSGEGGIRPPLERERRGRERAPHAGERLDVPRREAPGRHLALHPSPDAIAIARSAAAIPTGRPPDRTMTGAQQPTWRARSASYRGCRITSSLPEAGVWDF